MTDPSRGWPNCLGLVIRGDELAIGNHKHFVCQSLDIGDLLLERLDGFGGIPSRQHDPVPTNLATMGEDDLQVLFAHATLSHPYLAVPCDRDAAHLSLLAAAIAGSPKNKDLRISSSRSLDSFSAQDSCSDNHRR